MVMHVQQDNGETLELVRPNRLCQELVFADGIGSSGKGMLSHILGTFTRVEKQSNHTPFDYIAYIHWLGKISDDAASTYLKTEADQQLYHIMMSRDANFRPKDSTGVMQNAFSWKYLSRLFMQEGDPVVERIRAERPILNEAPHDALRSAPLFFSTFGDSLRIIYIIRNPYELIIDWDRRGFGRRIGVDPREFQFSVKKENDIIPMFMINYHEEFDYSRLNPIERLTLMIHFCVKTNMDGYLKCPEDRRKQILITTFDDLCTAPWEVVDRIKGFLNVKQTGSTARMLKKERLPRDRPEPLEFRGIVTKQLDKRFDRYIEDLDSSYERFVSLKNG